MMYQIVKEPHFQNFTSKCCFLTWRRASENVDCYPKMGTHLFSKMSLEHALGKCLFWFFKVKNEKKLNKSFPLTTSKTILPTQNSKKVFLSTFFQTIVLWSKKKVFAIFQKKYNFLRSLRFFENKESLPWMRQIADFLGIELELKFTQSAGMCQFLKIAKSAISLHPNLQPVVNKLSSWGTIKE